MDLQARAAWHTLSERIFYARSCHVFMSEACGQLRLAVSCRAVVPTRSASLTPLERVRGSSNYLQEFRYANPKNNRYPPPKPICLMRWILTLVSCLKTSTIRSALPWPWRIRQKTSELWLKVLSKFFQNLSTIAKKATAISLTLWASFMLQVVSLKRQITLIVWLTNGGTNYARTHRFEHG